MTSINITRAASSRSRLACLTSGIVLAISLVIPAAALAEPEFKPTGRTFTNSGGAAELKAGGNSVACTSDTASGTISSATLAGGVTIDFKGCISSSSAGASCAVNSTNTSTEGLILTNTLHAVLGLILPKGTGSAVGVLVLPVANKKFVTLASNKCTIETTVSGDVAGEVSPIGSSQTTSKVVFRVGSSGESIKEFDLSTGGKVKPELEAFGAVASVEGTGAPTFSGALEVT